MSILLGIVLVASFLLMPLWDLIECAYTLQLVTIDTTGKVLDYERATNCLSCSLYSRLQGSCRCFHLPISIKRVVGQLGMSLFE